VDREAIARVSRQVSKTFPEMSGARPAVKPQAAPAGGREQYLLTYRGKAALPGGRSLTRIVRVVADARGMILRISTSR
jgi:hypothetical protein